MAQPPSSCPDVGVSRRRCLRPRPVALLAKSGPVRLLTVLAGLRKLEANWLGVWSSRHGGEEFDHGRREFAGQERSPSRNGGDSNDDWFRSHPVATQRGFSVFNAHRNWISSSAIGVLCVLREREIPPADVANEGHRCLSGQLLSNADEHIDQSTVAGRRAGQAEPLRDRLQRHEVLQSANNNDGTAWANVSFYVPDKGARCQGLDGEVVLGSQVQGHHGQVWYEIFGRLRRVRLAAGV